MNSKLGMSLFAEQGQATELPATFQDLLCSQLCSQLLDALTRQDGVPRDRRHCNEWDANLLQGQKKKSQESSFSESVYFDVDKLPPDQDCSTTTAKGGRGPGACTGDRGVALPKCPGLLAGHRPRG